MQIALPTKAMQVNSPAETAMQTGKLMENKSVGRNLHSAHKRIAEALPGQPYDPSLADQSARMRFVLFDARFREIASRLIFFLWVSLLEELLPPNGLSKGQIKGRRAARLREVCVDLGPTFIKVGQFLSVRRDILAKETADELALLQDRVPSFGFPFVREIIREELGSEPEEIFAEIEPVPLASASIGQVHRVTLLDGTQAVVKVQRPDLVQNFYKDLGYIRLWARFAFLFRASKEVWLDLSNEFGKVLFKEIDYIQEGKNADRLRKLFRNDPRIRIPRVFWKHTGRRVLTIEYLPGTKIDNLPALEAQGVDLKELGNLLISCYLEQLLWGGCFHADPHAGNLAVDRQGNLIIYDFGMIGEMTEVQRRSLIGCAQAIVLKDTGLLVANLVDLGVVREDANLEPIGRALRPLTEYYAGLDINDLNFTNLEEDIDKVIFDRSLSLPPSLAYFLRALSSLEGIARTLRPNFSFVEAASPILKRSLAEGKSTLGIGFLRDLAMRRLGRQNKPVEMKRADNNTLSDFEVKPDPLERAVLYDLSQREKELSRRLNLTFLCVLCQSCFMFVGALAIMSSIQIIWIYVFLANIVLLAVIIWQLLGIVRSDANRGIK